MLSTFVPGVAIAQSSTGTLSGNVVTQQNGLAVSGATVTLAHDGAPVASSTSDNNGNYSFADVARGIYSVTISAIGYSSARADSVVVTGGATVVVRTPLLSADTANDSREIIGTTSARNRANTLASSSTIQTNLDPQQLAQQGFVKAADALASVPGVNLSGGPHTIGDDTFIDIRGMGAGEVRALIDGHPVGPFGVDNLDTYNYVNSPFSLLQNVQVTVGSGASGLYGVDVIGGTIDFQTLNPTAKPHFDFTQTNGNDNTAASVFKATGSYGNFGYAIGHAVSGTTGAVPPQLYFQGGRPNNNANLPGGGACSGQNPPPIDLTTCNQVLNTYWISGAFKTLNDLGKIRYNFTPTTALTLAAYASNTRTDNTGNGDNDFMPYATKAALISAQPQNCPGGYLVTIDTNPNACYTAQQVAAASSGGFGGGEDRNRGTTLQDFNASFTSQIGINNISLDTYSDYYNFHKYSGGSSGLDPTGTYLYGPGGTFTDAYFTHGFLATDDIATSNNDVGFGYFVEHQQTSGNNLAGSGAPNYALFFTSDATLGEGDYSFFLRDNWTPSEKFAIYLNAWDHRSSVTQHTTFDPRISFVYKPTGHDVVRLTGGEADGDPGVNLVQAGSLSGFNNPLSLNPSCNTLNSVASGGNPNLTSERSKDLEVGYGHRFWSDTSINLVGYTSSVNNQLFSGVIPITPEALANPNISGQLGGFAAKINSACGTTYTAATIAPALGLNSYFNAATALFRGIELSGRIRATKQIALDLTYDVQSSQQFGEPIAVLQTNPYILDGGQIAGITPQKGSVSLDYSNGGFEGQIQDYSFAANNPLNRPAYNYFNGFVSQKLAKNVNLSFSVFNVFNVFNQNAQSFGYFGEQLPHATNQYNPYTGGAIGQVVAFGASSVNELLGLQPRLASLTITIHL